MLSLDKILAGFTPIVDAISNIDLLGGFEMGGTPSTGFGKVPFFTDIFPCPSLSPSASVDADAGVFTPIPVGGQSPSHHPPKPNISNEYPQNLLRAFLRYDSIQL